MKKNAFIKDLVVLVISLIFVCGSLYDIYQGRLFPDPNRTIDKNNSGSIVPLIMGLIFAFYTAKKLLSKK